MDLLEFIAALVSSGAWPLGAVSLALILRRPLSDLLRRPDVHVKGPGFEVRALRELQEAAGRVAQMADVGGAGRQEERHERVERVIRKGVEAGIQWGRVHGHDFEVDVSWEDDLPTVSISPRPLPSSPLEEDLRARLRRQPY